MFGQNIPRRREHGDDLQVHSVFYTIQGEGPFAGRPAVFVRLTGCNLRCWFCDTTWGDESDPKKHFTTLAQEAHVESLDKDGEMRTRLVVITGGEPLRQDLGPLIKSLLIYGFDDIQVETAGTFWQDCLDWPEVTVVVSPKNKKVNPEYRSRRVNWKYVLKAGEVSSEDGLPNAPMQRVGEGKIAGGAPARPNPGDRVYLQPVDEYDDEANKANLKAVAESSLTFGHTAGVQIHKYLELD